MTIDIDTLICERVRAALRLEAANRVKDTAETEAKAALDALRAAQDALNNAVAAEIKRLVDEAA